MANNCNRCVSGLHQLMRNFPNFPLVRQLEVFSFVRLFSMKGAAA
jgi:hypothetical protein